MENEIVNKQPNWLVRTRVKLWLVLLIVIVVAAGASFLSWSVSAKQEGIVCGAAIGGPERLILVKSSATRFVEPWKNSIDGDVDGFNGTTLARVISREEPHAVYEFKDGQKRKISSVRIMTDTGLRKRDRYLLQEFTVQVASQGSNYVTVLDHVKKDGGGWQSYNFEAVEVRYIKLILHKPIDKRWIQLGEFEVYQEPRSQLLIERSDDYQDSYLTGNSSGLDIGKFNLKAVNGDILIEQIYVDIVGETDKIIGFYLYDGQDQITEAVIAPSGFVFEMVEDPLMLAVDMEKELSLKVDTGQASALENFTPIIRSSSMVIRDSTGEAVEIEESELVFPSYILVKSQPKVIFDYTGEVVDGNGIYSLAQVSIMADAQGPVGIYKMSFQVATTTVTADYFELFEGSDLIVTDGIKRTSMGEDYELIEVYFDDYQQIDAGHLKTYILSATVRGYDATATSSVSTVMLGDADFAVTGYRLDAAEVDAMDHNDFIWSDLSYGVTTTTATTTKGWLNGYLIDGLLSPTSSAKTI